MLAAKRLPEVLRSVLTDGVEGAVVMTSEGSVMASEFLATHTTSSSLQSSASFASSAGGSATISGGLGGNLLNPLLNETSIAAIAATVWNNCSLGILMYCITWYRTTWYCKSS